MGKKGKMMFFVDANIFLEVALKDKKSDECKGFLRNILEKRFDAFTSDFIVYTCILQIENKLKSTEKIEDFVVFLSNIENLKLIRPDLESIKMAAAIAKKYKLTFDDALVVSCMSASNIKRLVSFDKDFDIVNEIERTEPSAVTNNTTSP